jgi:hypothetical protein
MNLALSEIIFSLTGKGTNRTDKPEQGRENEIKILMREAGVEPANPCGNGS